ncbi:PEST proteolytic signal-containing nuclear protein-like [Aricia agestis]|uniref:PEST proteolytic signal-containing nuclear protein-like n=1 Tax=Aricia agestis TaxID=91739 RepID=UPI001C2046A8|nr:PEST proteolytic signal-containing nuclear protein-like [Aricia agestis]
MGDRYRDYKGSSRPSRDDSRRSKERRRHSRSRSRSPRRKSPYGARDSDRPRHRDRSSEYDRRKSSREWEDSDEEVPAPPPPPRITKISIGFSKPKAPIKMTLSGNALNKAPIKPTVASVFNADEDDEQEEMPAEARMRMRNIGRETPTSAGPNSFGKTKQGFCDAKKVFEKNLKEALDSAEKPIGKLPQTIYKISKGP